MSRAAYLLFYRRRSPVPLGPLSLQQIVTAANSPDSEPSSADDDHEPRSRSPAGNGWRLGDSSRNGSSNAGAAAAGVAAQRAAGSQRSAAATLPRSAAAAASLTDDDEEMDTLPNYADEGFHDAEEDEDGSIDHHPTGYYRPSSNSFDEPLWSFNSLSDARNLASGGNDTDDAASDAPNLGSVAGDDLSARLREDFSDDDVAMRPGGGVGTPVEGIHPSLGGEGGDEDVAEIRLRGE